jgi:hypothetical protein
VLNYQLNLDFEKLVILPSVLDCRADVMVFELVQPMLDFIKQSNKLQTLESEFLNYDTLTKNTVEAKMDFIL